MPYDSSNRKHVTRAEKTARVADRDRRAVTRSLMANRQGRAWLYDLLERCHVFATSFSTNALTMAASEGERNIGLMLLAEVMTASPREYITMMEEQNARRSARDNTDYDADSDDNSRDLYDDNIGATADYAEHGNGAGEAEPT